jgi:integrase
VASIRTLKSGRHQVRWTYAGKESSTTFGTIREAERWRRDVAVIISRGEEPRPGHRVHAVDLLKVIPDHVRWCITVREYAANTIRARCSALNNLQRFLRTIRPRGILRAELLDGEHIERFYVWLRHERGNAANSAQVHVRHVMRFWTWCARHPAYGRHMATVVEPLLPATTPALRPYAPRWADADAAILTMADDWQRRLAVVCRFTGLRVVQAKTLQWADINMARKVMTVASGKTLRERRGRVAPLAPAFVAELAAWGVRSGAVCGAPASTSRTPDRAMRKAWLAGTGEVPRQPFHSMRRMFVSELRRARVQHDIVQYLVGHARGITGDVYLDPGAIMAEAREAVALIPAIGAGAVVRLEVKGE